MKKKVLGYVQAPVLENKVSQPKYQLPMLKPKREVLTYKGNVSFNPDRTVSVTGDWDMDKPNRAGE